MRKLFMICLSLSRLGYHQPGMYFTPQQPTLPTQGMFYLIITKLFCFSRKLYRYCEVQTLERFFGFFFLVEKP